MCSRFTAKKYIDAALHLLQPPPTKNAHITRISPLQACKRERDHTQHPPTPIRGRLLGGWLGGENPANIRFSSHIADDTTHGGGEVEENALFLYRVRRRTLGAGLKIIFFSPRVSVVCVGCFNLHQNVPGWEYGGVCRVLETGTKKQPTPRVCVSRRNTSRTETSGNGNVGKVCTAPPRDGYFSF